jgi:hypothetical protein
MKEGVYGRQGTIELELNDQKQKILDLEQATLKHATTVNETLENEIGRFERVISAFEKYIDTQTSDLRVVIGRQTEEGLKWRSEFEDLNTKKIIEIHNALKLLNQNIGKVNSDSKDRFDMVSQEARVLENAVTSQLQDIRLKSEIDDRTLEERIQFAVDKIYGRLKSQMDDQGADYNKLIQDTNKLLREKFEANNRDIKSFIDTKTDDMRYKILEERRKLDTLVEGRCQAYTVEIERKLLARLKDTLSENQTLREEMLTKIEAATEKQNEVA